MLVRFAPLFAQAGALGPILDVAAGDGRNGLYLAEQNLDVICCDLSKEQLEKLSLQAEKLELQVTVWQVNLEQPGDNPFPGEAYGGVMVFRYLHRPLIPCIRKALKKGGLLMYETYTVEQAQFGKPHNPDFLLKPGELPGWFSDWEIIHRFEGIVDDPKRAIAQIVCRKPGS